MTDSFAQQIQHCLNNLTKPPGSLGQLERLAAELCRIQGTLEPKTTPRELVLFAGDHGVVEAGVSAWPSSVTGLMISNIRSGGAASSVLAKSSNTALRLLDVGSLSPLAGDDHLWRVRQGTRNLAVEPAMTVDEFHTALQYGRQAAREAIGRGAEVLAAGEMGIGNTTPASCLTMLLAEASVDEAVGPGAGSEPETIATKREVCRIAVERARRIWKESREAAIASVCGLEIAAMAGFYLQAHEAGKTIVLDGFVATAGALIARTIDSEVVQSMIAAHRSAEPGHRLQLAHLGLTPFLEWDLRLGEGTGALLLMPLLDAARAMITGMASFEDLGIDVG